MNTRERMEWNQKMKLRVYRGLYTERSDRGKKEERREGTGKQLGEKFTERWKEEKSNDQIRERNFRTSHSSDQSKPSNWTSQSEAGL